MAAPEKVTVKAIDWTPGILALLYDPTLSPLGGLASSEQAFHGCHLYQYENGDQAAYIAAKPVTLAGGVRLDVHSVKSTGKKMDGKKFAEAIELIAGLHGAVCMALMTKIPQIAQKCIDNGFAINGAVLIKFVKHD